MAKDHVMGFPRIRQTAEQCGLVGAGLGDDRLVDAVCELIVNQTEAMHVAKQLASESAKNAKEVASKAA